MARRDYVPSRSRMLWTVFCLMLCSLGFLGNAWGATIPVTTTADSGTGSLRDAITTANANAGDIINITATGTITLLSPLPAITANMTITGPGAASLTVSGNNSATVGTIFTIETGVTASISGLTIANGKSTDGAGIANAGTLSVSDCVISDNQASAGGTISSSGSLTVVGSTVSGNSGGQGGGIRISGGTATITNNTFSGNSASGEGGGIYVGSGTVTVTNSTLSGNSAVGGGGGIDVAGGTLTVTNTIVAGNNGNGAGDDILGTFTDGGGNVVSPSTPINLAPLANYGGPTQTMLPAPNSPAICAGTANSLTTDQRGFTIGSGYCTSGKIDSGAVQTKYTAIQFTNPNTGIGGYAAAVSSAVAFPAAPIVSVTENGLNQGGMPVTLTSDATGATGLGPVTTVAGTGATFDNIKVPEAGSFTLSATLTPGTATLNTSANLKIVSITLSPSTLAGATVNRPYTVTFSASGGSTSTFTFTLTGTPPPGITFNAGTATLAGTPTVTGSASLTVTATDSNGFTGTQSYTLTVNPAVTATQAVATKILTANHATTSFTPVTSSGGTTPLTYSISPALPAGLSISSATGAITGTPTAVSAPISYAVTVTDVNGSTATANFALTVNSAVTATLAVPTKMLTANQLASFTPVTGSGGTTPLTYSISPTLPAGLALNSSTGAITGTPTATSPQTTYTVTVTDNNQATATANFSLTVNAAVIATLVIPTKTLTANQSVSFTPVTGSGGTTPLIYTIAPSLPAGLNISSSTGAITGAPTATSATTTYTVTVTDSNNATATASFSVSVNAAVTATQTVPTKVLTANHATTSFTPVTGAGGTTPISFSISPVLPAGLTLNTSTGAITGTPTVASAAISYAVTVTDSNHATATASFSLTVNSAVTATQSVPTTMLTVSQSSASFTPVAGSGGTAPLGYTISPLLPAGLSLSATTGLITGTPTAVSAQTVYTMTVTDANQATATATFSLTVNSAVTAAQSVPATTLTVNQPVSFTPVTGSGGTTPLHYSISPSLSAGLSLNTSTGVITGTQTAISATTTYTVTVTDANQVTAQASFMLTVNQASTSVLVTSSSASNTSNVNDSVTFTANVTPYSGTTPIAPPFPGSAAAVTGSVIFTENGSSVCSTPVPVSLVSGNYVATCSTSSLQAISSPHTILATYSGNSNYSGSQNSVTQTVNPAASNTSLISSSAGNTSNVNQSVNFTATVTAPAGATKLSGTVTFTDNGNSISGCILPVIPATGSATTGTAICTTASLINGSHTIVATYANDKEFSTSNNMLTQTVKAIASSTAVASSLTPSIVKNPSNFHDSVIFTAIVTPISGPVQLSGAVTFTDNGTPILECQTAIPVNPSTGVATCSTISLSSGTHSILMTYGGDPNFTTSNNALTQTVQDYTLTSSPTAAVTVTQGFTSVNDPFTPQVNASGASTVTATPVPIQGFTGILALSCSVAQVTATSNAVLPQCLLSSSGLTINPAPPQTSVAITIDAFNSSNTPATSGAYTVTVAGVDSATGLIRSTTFALAIRYLAGPLNLTSGATTGNTVPVNFDLPAGVGLSQFQCASASAGPPFTTFVDPAGFSIACAFSPTSVASSANPQVGSVTVTISTNGTTAAMLTDRTSVFAASLLGIPILALIGFLYGGKSSGKTFFRFLAIVFMMATVLQGIGCGGSFTRPSTVTGGLTPAGSYLLLVQGTGTDKQVYTAVVQVNVVR